MVRYPRMLEKGAVVAWVPWQWQWHPANHVMGAITGHPLLHHPAGWLGGGTIGTV